MSASIRTRGCTYNVLRAIGYRLLAVGCWPIIVSRLPTPDFRLRRHQKREPPEVVDGQWEAKE